MRQAKYNGEINIDIDPKIFNDLYFPHLQTIHEYEVYYGGQASGKSFFISQKKLLQLTVLENRNMICLRKQSTDCYDSCWGQIITAMEQLKLTQFWNINRSDHILRNVMNGNCIYFDGVDKIENIKSFKPEKGNLTDVWYEEVSEEDLRANVLDIDGRIRDQFQKCSLILSFNPTYRQHWLFEFVNVFLRDKDALIIRSTHWDNKFVSAAYRQKTEALKYSDPYRYQVYGLGEWGVTGKTVFNANKIAERIRDLEDIFKRNPPKKIDFHYKMDDDNHILPSSVLPYASDSGETNIYIEPKSKRPYVLAVDTAGEGVDYYAAHVMDNITGEQVAVFHSVRAPDECVIQLFGLGMYYNQALLVPEINFDGAYLLYKFQELGYTNIYRRVNSPDELISTYEKRYGYRTTSGNRMYMLSVLKEWAELNMNKLYDLATLNEMLTFTMQVKRTKGIWWGAEAGAHDDLCFVKGTLILTENGQIPIEKIKIGDMVLTRDGFKPVEITTQSYKRVITKIGLTGTPNHPVITTKGIKPLEMVSDSDKLYIWNEALSVIEVKKTWNVKQLFTTEKNITDIQSPNTDNLGHIIGDTTNGIRHRSRYIGKFGLITLVQYLRDMLSIIKMKIPSIMKSTIWNVLSLESIVQIICKKKNVANCQGKPAKDKASELPETLQSGAKKTPKRQRKFILKAEKHRKIGLSLLCQNGAKKIQNSRSNLRRRMAEKQPLKGGGRVELVYNLQVFGAHEYFANNILVHNCMALAICLQGREQQATSEIAEKIPLKGEFYPEELEMAVKEGRFSREDVLEYKRTHVIFGKPYAEFEKKRGNRYARD